ncbi:TlpA family protein disulfide reductase [Mucilaginibacter sp. FT3.2]|uniref:TlpA family protein disulfide reductase n=1 Tax=Mucilaginibacter sp. FT3.2 TaxID=2723090 RepID=UPI0016108E87|nr:TlpA disulfide reductase family protein [Mucilaginibacter sp. FT3.2]MBB6232284.1 thiol-disulfide isomerase/thioredoxin [Mucilaginibacter sp. FT3.2]
MKTYLILLTFLAIFHFNSSAQSNPTVRKRMSFGMPNKNTLVLDSMGKVLTYQQWHSKIITGDYSLRGRQTSNTDTAYILTKLPDNEIASRLANMPPPFQGPFFNNGNPIKPFDIKDINGNKFAAADWAGKVVVFNFWFINCPPCRQEIPELNTIVTKNAGNKQVVFIGVCLDNKTDVEKFIKDLPFAYRQVANGKSITGNLGISQYPVNLVIDKHGIVQFNTTGYGPHWAKFIDEAIDKYKVL